MISPESSQFFFKNWARHINDYHKDEDVDEANAQDDGGDKTDDGNDVEHDGADQTDDVQPEEAAKPKKCYGPKRSEPPAAAPVRRQRDSVGDQGLQKAKKPNGKAACKKSQSQSSSCALLKASAYVTRSYLSM